MIKNIGDTSTTNAVNSPSTVNSSGASNAVRRLSADAANAVGVRAPFRSNEKERGRMFQHLQ